MTVVVSPPFSSVVRSGRNPPLLRHHRQWPIPINVSPSLCPQRKYVSNTQCWFKKSRKSDLSCRCSLAEAEAEDEETCGLVNGVEVCIGEGADNIQAYLCKAVKNNNETGVLLLSDIFGFEDSSTRDFAYRLACNGYNVLVPDLFRGDPWGKDRPRDMFEQWIAGHDIERVAKDITTSTKWMVDEFAAAGISNKLGLIGFCYGGGKVIDILAKDQGDNFGVGVSFYGTRIEAGSAANVKVPVLFVSGDRDQLCSVNGLYEMEKHIGKGSKVVIFEGRGHGFVHRPGSLDEDKDAEEAFLLMRNWLHDGLYVKN